MNEAKDIESKKKRERQTADNVSDAREDSAGHGADAENADSAESRTTAEKINSDENSPDAESRDALRAALEAVLFAAGYPVGYGKLAEALGTDEEDVKLLAKELSTALEDRKSGLQLLIFGDSCQICTREEHIDRIRAVLGVKRGGNLSRSSLETLAIVAYHQPVTRSYIDQIRGTDSSYAVGNLVDKRLIEVCGKLDAPGHPSLFLTTDDFLRVFGLSELSELPPIELFGEPDMTAVSETPSDGSETEKLTGEKPEASATDLTDGAEAPPDEPETES